LVFAGDMGINYVELKTRSNFSFLRGASHPEEIVNRAAELGYSAIGFADVNSLAGIVRAHVAAKNAGIKLLVGCELALYQKIPERLEDEETIPPEALIGRWDSFLSPLSLLAYPTCKAGYASLSKLLTLGKSRAPKGCCYLTIQDVLDSLTDCALIAYLAGEIESEILSKFNNLSLGVTNTYGPDNIERMRRQIALSRKLAIPLVATNDVYFHSPNRKKLQDILTCIRRGKTIDEIGYELQQNAERYLKPPQEMLRLFRELPQAVERTHIIYEQCKNFSLDDLRYEYPKEICPEGFSPLDYLKKLTWKGVREKYPQGIPEKVLKQIQHEFSLIEELNYAKYFLTVYDIVRFARSQNILCQGRGAAANSAICYCIGITAVDPDKINLLFERFISKERNEPPDIDIDFEHERREEVIQYIYSTYGRNRAALVCEVVSYRTKSAVREIGKTLDLTIKEIEGLIKFLRRFDEERPTPEQMKEFGLDPNNARIQLALELTEQLIGFPRHLSQHVGGFVISDPPLSEIVPIENASMPGRTVIEWDKDDIDAMGMLKIDCLALGMLSCIRKSLEMIGGLALHEVPREDPKVYDMICQADTIGVFQIESRAQMTMLPRLKPRCYYDLVIEVAIVRPGPMQGGMVHPYLRRRMGREKPFYPSPEIKRVLSPTLGVPIFQEQAMELVIVAAGFSAGEADQLRRAMASWKKNKNAIKKFEQKIINGVIEKGYSKEFGEQCFSQIKGFGEYGFPQSHSASFAHLVYVSAWIKRHHPAVFCAALINSQPMGFYQPSQIFQDAIRHGVEILPVDINFSEWDCTVAESQLRAGMRLVRGLPETRAKELIAAIKKHGPFKSISELWRYTKSYSSTLIALARADAFRSMNLSRQEALWELKRYRDHALPLIEEIDRKTDPVDLPEVGEENEMLNDYHHLSFSLKSHPMLFFRESLNQRGVITTEQLRSGKNNGRRAAIGGVVLIRQAPPTARGVVFLTIEDEFGTANLIIKPEIYKQFRDTIYDSVYLLAFGKIQSQEGVTHLLVESAENLRPPEEERLDIARNFY